MRKVLLHMVFLLFYQGLMGQSNGLTLKELATDLNEKYSVTLFYPPELDTFRLDISSQNLGDIIKEVERETSLFIFQRGNNLIVTNSYRIRADLDPAFFEPKIQETPNEPSILQQLRDKESALKARESRLIEIGNISQRYRSRDAKLEGYIKERESGEPIPGASIYIKNPSIGVTTDNNGFYSINLPRGKHEIYYKSVGMLTTRRNVMLYSDGSLGVDMDPNIIALEAVEVTGTRENIDNVQTGMVMLELKDIKQIPTVLGEADILKIALTLPGVQSVGEGAAGINVRGGGVDQNLIMLDEVPVYNPTHLFGFFSAFNPETLSSATLYKSGIRANYGSRVSSVFDVKLRKPDKEKYKLSGGISPITGKLTLEGPILKEKSSFLLGLRSTYSNWLFTLLDDPALRNSEGSFSDVILKIDHKINEKNNIRVSGYHSRDRFRLNSDSLYRYFNSHVSLQWQHFFKDNFYVNSAVSYINYSNELTDEQNPVSANQIDYQINQVLGKIDFNYFPEKKYNLNFGGEVSYYDLNPGSQTAVGDSSLITPTVLDTERGIESAVYIGSEYEWNSQLSLYAGFRFSSFSLLGPGDVFVYEPDAPKETEFITDTLNFSSGQTIQTYSGPEIRFSARYKLSPDLSLKFSFDRSRQYIHMLSNTTTISPIDTWRLSNRYIKPQIGDQISLGVYKSFLSSGIELSLEGYYKKLQNLLEYKDAADLLLNEVLETDVIGADGKSYGLEFLLKKNSGRLNGWVSYTWSRALVRAESSFSSETINNGQFFPSNFDKPHNLTIISNYKITKRFSSSLNMTYSSGRPVTVPIGQYIYEGEPILLYSDRNKFRIPDYFRVDLSLNWDGNHKVNKKIHGSWSFSIYNLTGRDNAYSVFFRRENGEINSYKLSVFAQPIPTLTYNFEIR